MFCALGNYCNIVHCDLHLVIADLQENRLFFFLDFFIIYLEVEEPHFKFEEVVTGLNWMCLQDLSLALWNNNVSLFSYWYNVVQLTVDHGVLGMQVVMVITNYCDSQVSIFIRLVCTLSGCGSGWTPGGHGRQCQCPNLKGQPGCHKGIGSG